MPEYPDLDGLTFGGKAIEQRDGSWDVLDGRHGDRLRLGRDAVAAMIAMQCIVEIGGKSPEIHGSGYSAYARSGERWVVDFDTGGHGGKFVHVSITAEGLAKIVYDPRRNFLRVLVRYMSYAQDGRWEGPS